MASELQIDIQPAKLQTNEIMRVNPSKGEITGTFSVHQFTDKDTHHIVLYCPSLEITGYGDTRQEAEEMLRFCFSSVFEELAVLSHKQLVVKLREMGWKHTTGNKEYSKAYVDIHGELQNFNAVDNKVEELTLTAA